MRHDVLSDVLSAMRNADRSGKKSVLVPSSKLAKEILMILQKYEYVGNFELIEDGKGNRINVEIFGKINNCGSIRPRFSAKSTEYEKWERRFLPASGVGMIIISTSKGLMPITEAKNQKLGGKLIAFIY